ncbi:hypothetical protein [Nocardiopsis composta]|uniref:Amino acid transporter n=1 Tax=Nocardiopsis composta TaxID=157465 RepID=A0A7W8VCL6_9ACTN|nr:hypothetical protein [Nocardiopsis composta]MBB5431337.1 amino acid transporter [Nocardiopsis composta]
MSGSYAMGAAGVALLLGGFVLGLVSSGAGSGPSPSLMDGSSGADPWAWALGAMGVVLLGAALAARGPAKSGEK